MSKMKGLFVVFLGTALAVLGESSAGHTRVLFVGNSFTFVNELPEQLVHVASSLGQQVTVNSSTIGGCTAYAQTFEHDNRTAALLEQDWDFIVVQSYSALPAVHAAREQYLYPAVRSFAAHKRKAKIVSYLTWGYHDGEPDPCPTSGPAACFPLGTLAQLTEPPCANSSHHHELAGSFACMGYALARGYLSTKDVSVGADMVAPCGLAWQVVRGLDSIPGACKASVDGEYTAPLTLPLPLAVGGARLPGFMLYRNFSGLIDKHPNVAGQYLNALTFFATLFGSSPVGAAPPLNTGSSSAGDRPLTAAEVRALQMAAHGVVQQCGEACGL